MHTSPTWRMVHHLGPLSRKYTAGSFNIIKPTCQQSWASHALQGGFLHSQRSRTPSCLPLKALQHMC